MSCIKKKNSAFSSTEVSARIFANENLSNYRIFPGRNTFLSFSIFETDYVIIVEWKRQKSIRLMMTCGYFSTCCVFYRVVNLNADCKYLGMPWQLTQPRRIIYKTLLIILITKAVIIFIHERINPLPSGRRTDWPYTHLIDKCSKKA